MLNITKTTEIDFFPLDSNEHVYIFPKGVLVALKSFGNNKVDIQVTNANHVGSDFNGKSFGGKYVDIIWAKDRLDYWIEQSTKTI